MKRDCDSNFVACSLRNNEALLQKTVNHSQERQAYNRRQRVLVSDHRQGKSSKFQAQSKFSTEGHRCIFKRNTTTVYMNIIVVILESFKPLIYDPTNKSYLGSIRRFNIVKKIKFRNFRN